MMYDHQLRLSHSRRLDVSTFADPPVDSDIEISASSSDLVEAWRELLSRLPNDVYGALKEAMPNIKHRAKQ